MPDAIEITGRALVMRREKLQVMTVRSDGWPFRYTNIHSSASEIINNLEAADMAGIRIGAQSGRMEYLFASHSTSFVLKQFVNRFIKRFYQVCDNMA